MSLKKVFFALQFAVVTTLFLFDMTSAGVAEVKMRIANGVQQPAISKDQQMDRTVWSFNEDNPVKKIEQIELSETMQPHRNKATSYGNPIASEPEFVTYTVSQQRPVYPPPHKGYENRAPAAGNYQPVQQANVFPPPHPARQAFDGSYKIALFPWMFYKDGSDFAGIVTEELIGQVRDARNIEWSTSFYHIKNVEKFRPPQKAIDFFDDSSKPRADLMAQLGQEHDFNLAVIGRLNVHCSWSDNCYVNNLDFHMIDLVTGKVYSEKGSDWDVDARNYIGDTAAKVFRDFISATK